ITPPVPNPDRHFRALRSRRVTAVVNLQRAGSLAQAMNHPDARQRFAAFGVEQRGPFAVDSGQVAVLRRGPAPELVLPLASFPCLQTVFVINLDDLRLTYQPVPYAV